MDDRKDGNYRGGPESRLHAYTWYEQQIIDVLGLSLIKMRNHSLFSVLRSGAPSQNCRYPYISEETPLGDRSEYR